MSNYFFGGIPIKEQHPDNRQSYELTMQQYTALLLPYNGEWLTRPEFHLFFNLQSIAHFAGLQDSCLLSIPR